MRQGYVMSPLSYMTFAESFLNSFNKNLFKDYPNKLCEFIPELDNELYDMVKIFEFNENKLEFYHDMQNDESICILDSK